MDFWDDCQIIQVTILVAADGALKFPKITRPADLEAVLQKLNSIPAREIQVWRIFPIFHSSQLFLNV
jgi:uncharacterized membrane protein